TLVGGVGRRLGRCRRRSGRRRVSRARGRDDLGRGGGWRRSRRRARPGRGGRRLARGRGRGRAAVAAPVVLRCVLRVVRCLLRGGRLGVVGFLRRNRRGVVIL